MNIAVESNYLKIVKNDELFFIRKKTTDVNINFWENHYSNWENETFAILDKFLKKDKTFIDIGGWIGAIAMYASRKSKHVYSIEADVQSYRDMSVNMKTNCEQNYTLINKAIYHRDDVEIKFGKNRFLPNAKLNDSTSQICEFSDNSSDFYLIKTISLNSVINNYNINPIEICLIKVDIEGAEEYILHDLYAMHKAYAIPLYVSFHLDWFKDKNLDRFTFLTPQHKRKIISNPLTTILF